MSRRYRTIAFLALTVSGKRVGTFNLYAAEPEFFDAEELRPFDELATDLAFALESIEGDRRRRQAEERARRLAAFPELNPNPVREFAADGTLTYQNAAAATLAQPLGVESLTTLLPPDTAAVVRTCLATGQPRLRLEEQLRQAQNVAGLATVTLEVQDTRSAPLAPRLEETWEPFRHEFRTGPDQYWLSRMQFRLSGPGTAWLADLSLREADGGPELLWEADVNRPRRGTYNPLACFWLDELLRAAQRHGLYLQLCLLRCDLYLADLQDPAHPAYDRATAAVRKTLRYAVARWGAFSSVAAWEHWNEMAPACPPIVFTPNWVNSSNKPTPGATCVPPAPGDLRHGTVATRSSTWPTCISTPGPPTRRAGATRSRTSTTAPVGCANALPPDPPSRASAARRTTSGASPMR